VKTITAGLWIGTEDGGLNIFDKQTGDFKRFSPSGKKTDIAYFNITACYVQAITYG
jgi:hypothetical protein